MPAGESSSRERPAAESSDVLLALLALALVAVALAAPLLFRAAEGWSARRARGRRARRVERRELRDPGRERRAEQRARELLRSCVNDEEWAMYRDLGFILVNGRLSRKGRGGAREHADDAGAVAGATTAGDLGGGGGGAGAGGAGGGGPGGGGGGGAPPAGAEPASVRLPDLPAKADCRLRAED